PARGAPRFGRPGPPFVGGRGVVAAPDVNRLRRERTRRGGARLVRGALITRVIEDAAPVGDGGGARRERLEFELAERANLRAQAQHAHEPGRRRHHAAPASVASAAMLSPSATRSSRPCRRNAFTASIFATASSMRA